MSGLSLAGRLLALSALTLALAAPASAQWTCLSGDCRSGTGRGQRTTSGDLSMTYVGDFRNGEPAGWGIIDYSNGHHYEGEWSEGLFEGNGIYTWPNGQRYDGRWMNDTRDGVGVLVLSNGTRYEGTFTQNNRDGLFTVVYPDGRRRTRVQFVADEEVGAAPASSRTIALGRVVSGALTNRSAPRDVPGLGDRAADDYRIGLTSGQTVTVRMEGDFDTYLRVLDGGETLAYNDDAGSTSVSEVEFTAPRTGTFTVRATTFREDGRGSYSLLATLGGGGGSGDETVIQGTISDSDAVVALTLGNDSRKADPFVISVRAGQTLRIEMTSPDFDTYLRVEKGGTKVAHNDDAGSTRRSYVEYVAPESGIYAIYAGTFSESGRGSYTLRYSAR